MMITTTDELEMDLVQLVGQVATGDSAASAALYKRFARYRHFFARSTGATDAEDLYQSLMLQVTCQIREGHVREPLRIAGYIRTIAVRMRAIHHREACRSRESHMSADDVVLRSQETSPEQGAIDQQNRLIAEKVLQSLSERDRTVLIRFYLNEESPEVIQADIGLTPTQFRLIKSRAKAAFTQRCESRMQRKSTPDRRPKYQPV
jgi:RNA polymerase sigma-70 factor, ECF subfamily